MNELDKDRVLRVNCPGFGVQTYFSSGCAKPLDNYDAILVNAISILHLFDKDPELLRQIEAAQQDGMTSYVAKSDKLVQSILPDLDSRKVELANFLANGGLLVYFLNPPFIVQGPQEVVDNYAWLDVLAPDKPREKERHMSAASRGKNIEPTPEGQKSHFTPYFKQTGVEWNTIIRAEFLTEGYTMLATAGPNKCIAAQLEAGDKGGLVVFLPAPYHPDLDNALLQCVKTWYESKASGAPRAASEPPAAKRGAAEPAAAPYSPPPPGPAPEPVSTAPAEPVEETKDKPEPLPESRYEPEPPPPETVAEEPPEMLLKAEEAEEAEAPEPPMAAKPKVEPAPRNNKKKDQPRAETPEEPPAPPPESPTKAKEIMEKMEEVSRAAVPDWCQKYSFSDLEQLREQLVELNEQVRLTQEKIGDVEGRIQMMEWLKNSLLSADGDELMQSCTRVFEQLGWEVRPAESNKHELWLADENETAAIVRVVRTSSQVKRSDLAQLAESVITYWGEHETEPKGVLIASTWANRPPSERTEPDYTEALSEFAEKKHLCLMTTTQLLCIYRDIEGGYMSADNLRESILGTSGRLEGFTLEPHMAAVP